MVPEADGVRTLFTLTGKLKNNTETVFKNGILQYPGGVDYKVIDAYTIEFFSPPEEDDILLATYIKE